jgi:hypothetical protein
VVVPLPPAWPDVLAVDAAPPPPLVASGLVVLDEPQARAEPARMEAKAKGAKVARMGLSDEGRADRTRAASRAMPLRSLGALPSSL